MRRLCHTNRPRTFLVTTRTSPRRNGNRSRGRLHRHVRGYIGRPEDSDGVVFETRDVDTRTVCSTPSLRLMTRDGINAATRVRPLALGVNDGGVILVGYRCVLLLCSTKSKHGLELDCFGIHKEPHIMSTSSLKGDDPQSYHSCSLYPVLYGSVRQDTCSLASIFKCLN